MMEIVFFMGDLIQVVTVCVLNDQRAAGISGACPRLRTGGALGLLVGMPTTVIFALIILW